jgi:hypothetical protein
LFVVAGRPFLLMPKKMNKVVVDEAVSEELAGQFLSFLRKVGLLKV